VSTVNAMLKKTTPIEVMREQFKGQIPDEDLEKMLTSIKEDREKRSEGVRDRNPVNLTQGSDTWGIGVTAYQMLERDDPFGFSKFMSDVEKKYNDFGSNPDNRVYKAPQGSNVKLTPEQELINGMMHPDPKQRLTPEQALKSEVFKNEQIGAAKIRDFLSNPIFRDMYKAMSTPPGVVSDELKNKLGEISTKVKQ
jgi:serine/threonine protein kinase